jgi:membrane protein implicated in regulation of membrane protease activity
MWLIMAGTLVILELFSGTFYLLMVAIGMSAGALVASLGGMLWQQLLVAAVVGASATLSLQRSKVGKAVREDASRDPNINLDIGQKVAVSAWHEQIGTPPRARVHYRGAHWDVELAPGNVAAPGEFTIVEMRGSRLILSAGTASTVSDGSSDNNKGG